MWKPVEELSEDEKSSGRNYLVYHKDWIDEDFCPDGITVGYFSNADDQGEWCAAFCDGEGEWTFSYVIPSHYRPNPEPPASAGNVP